MPIRAVMVAAAFLLPIQAAHAGLNGATVGEQYRFPDLASPYGPVTYAPQSFTVGAGTESVVVVEGVTSIAVDFADASLGLDFDTVLGNPTWNTAPFNGLVFTSAAFGQITGIAINASSNFAGFTASRASVVGNELRLDWNGLSYTGGTVLNLDFTVASVPEPESWALMVGGFGLVGAVVRRRRTTVVLA